MSSAIQPPPTATNALTELSPGALRGADFAGLPHALGRPAASGVIRNSAQDFRVREALSFPLTGAGEHLYLRVCKTGQNTRWVARQIARSLDLPLRAIGYAGLKDRHAETEQWFSVHLPGRADPAGDALDIEGVRILETRRHAAKLRTGALSGNRFKIRVTDLQGDHEECAARLERLRLGLVPNYFGPQRFGRDGGNLRLLRGGGRLSREARSFGLSALRSALFNAWLAQRVEDGSWQTPLDGEIAYCEADNKYRHVDRVAEADGMFRPTGLLWGEGDNQSTGIAAARERDFFERNAADAGLLATHGVRMMRRSLCIRALDLDWDFAAGTLELQFGLGRGQFATALLREIIDFKERD